MNRDDEPMHCGNPQCRMCNRMFGPLLEDYDQHVMDWCDSWNGQPHETKAQRAWLEKKATEPTIH